MRFSVGYLDQTADRVKAAFLKQGAAPNDTIALIAREDNLNIEQIQRVCEASNLAIKRAAADPGAVFPLAIYEDVVASIQPSIKMASTQDTPELSKVAAFVPPSDQSKGIPLSEAVMQKRASRNDQKRYSTLTRLHQGMDNAIEATAKEIGQMKVAARRTAHDLFEMLRKEAGLNGSINNSYSVFMDTFRDEASRQHIYDFYKAASAALGEYSRPCDSLEYEKTAGYVDTGSPLYVKMSDYLAKMADLHRKNLILEKLAKYHEEFGKRLKL